MTVTLTVTVKTFSLENVAKMKRHSPNIEGYKKKQGQISNVKFFTADLYIKVVFSTGLRKGAQNSTFLRFKPYRGGGVRKHMDPKI